MKNVSIIFVFLTLTLFISTAVANDIIITAKEKVEVYQNEKKAIAVGKAAATQNDLTVHGDQLTVFFSDNQNHKNDISKMNAQGNVHLKMPKADAFGTRLEYYVKEDYMVIIGNPATIKNEKATVRASDNITYYPKLNKAIAKGNVIADNGKNKIYADIMETYFKTEKNGEQVLQRVEIPKNPKIVTKDGNVTAQSGIYYPEQGKVFLYDDVVITQNNNVLKGSRAETDFNTGISKVLSGSKRVSGIWYEDE